MSLLLQMQQEYAKCVVTLLQKIVDDGNAFTFGEAYRSQEQAEINALAVPSQRKSVEALLSAQYPELAAAIGGSTSKGIRNSVHRLKLALDLNIFVGPDHAALAPDSLYKTYGDWWKQQNPNARYGGDWGDGDHYSFEYQGVK